MPQRNRNEESNDEEYALRDEEYALARRKRKRRRQGEETEDVSPMMVLTTIGRGFLLVCDFGFKRYWTPWIVRIWWSMFLVASVILFAWLTFGPATLPGAHPEFPPRNAAPMQPPSGFQIALDNFLMWLIKLYSFVWFLITVRIICEFFIVLFDISNQTKETNRQLKRLA
jgi:hypothetical protein